MTHIATTLNVLVHAYPVEFVLRPLAFVLSLLGDLNPEAVSLAGGEHAFVVIAVFLDPSPGAVGLVLHEGSFVEGACGPDLLSAALFCSVYDLAEVGGFVVFD